MAASPKRKRHGLALVIALAVGGVAFAFIDGDGPTTSVTTPSDAPSSTARVLGVVVTPDDRPPDASPASPATFDTDEDDAAPATTRRRSSSPTSSSTSPPTLIPPTSVTNGTSTTTPPPTLIPPTSITNTTTTTEAPTSTSEPTTTTLAP